MIEVPYGGLFGPTDRLIERALDVVAERQRVSAHNIANVDTPGYKRLSIDFESALKAAHARTDRLDVKVTHPRHFRTGAGQVESDIAVSRAWDSVMRNDGNNVDIEAEMAQLAKDEVLYNALVEQVRRRYAMLRDAITEGRV